MAVFRDVRGRTVESANFADFNALRDSGKLKGRFGTLASVSYVDKAVSHGSRMPLGGPHLTPSPSGASEGVVSRQPPNRSPIDMAQKQWSSAITKTDRHAKSCEKNPCAKCNKLMDVEGKWRDQYIRLGGRLPVC